MTIRVVVSRKWHSPEIAAFVNDKEVGAAMQLPDFLRALAAQVGSPALMVTKGGLEKAILAASDAVLREMKSMTRYVA